MSGESCSSVMSTPGTNIGIQGCWCRVSTLFLSIKTSPRAKVTNSTPCSMSTGVYMQRALRMENDLQALAPISKTRFLMCAWSSRNASWRRTKSLTRSAILKHSRLTWSETSYSTVDFRLPKRGRLSSMQCSSAFSKSEASSIITCTLWMVTNSTTRSS